MLVSLAESVWNYCFFLPIELTSTSILSLPSRRLPSTLHAKLGFQLSIKTTPFSLPFNAYFLKFSFSCFEEELKQCLDVSYCGASVSFVFKRDCLTWLAVSQSSFWTLVLKQFLLWTNFRLSNFSFYLFIYKTFLHFFSYH